MEKRYKRYSDATRYRKKDETTIWIDKEPAKPAGYENIKFYPPRRYNRKIKTINKSFWDKI